MLYPGGEAEWETMRKGERREKERGAEGESGTVEDDQKIMRRNEEDEGEKKRKKKVEKKKRTRKG